MAGWVLVLMVLEEDYGIENMVYYGIDVCYEQGVGVENVSADNTRGMFCYIHQHCPINMLLEPISTPSVFSIPSR